MSAKISVVINTYNEEVNIERCLRSVIWADDIVIVDMYSTDRTIRIAKKFNTRIFSHKQTQYVEPARNYAISKAKYDWILVVDADEEIPITLAKKLRVIADSNDISHVLIPRKNIVLGKWLKYCAEWANHQTRFFKKELADWSSDIHKQPFVKGKGYRLPALEKYAIVHHYYSTISEFVSKFDVYTYKHALRIKRNKIPSRRRS